MKSLKILGLSLSILSPVYAQAESAEIAQGLMCYQLDSKGGLVKTYNSMNVNSRSKTEAGMFHCKGEGLFNDTGKTIVYDYENTGSKYTCMGSKNWVQILTPNGIAITNCHMKL